MILLCPPLVLGKSEDGSSAWPFMRRVGSYGVSVPFFLNFTGVCSRGLGDVVVFAVPASLVSLVCVWLLIPFVVILVILMTLMTLMSWVLSLMFVYFGLLVSIVVVPLVSRASVWVLSLVVLEVLFQGLGGIGGVSLVGPSWCLGSGRGQVQSSPLDFFSF